MKHHIFIPLLTLCAALSVFSATAQKQPVLKDIRDASLPQLMKQKKDIRFVYVPGSRGNTLKWYEESKPVPQQEVLTQPSAAGSPTNFHLTKDINTQTDADPVNNDFIFNNPYAILNGVFYFSANDGIHGSELWRSDGTAAGTYLVKDLLTGSASSFPHELVTAGNKLYFVTQDNTFANNGLWVSDGTANGTTRLATFQRQGPGVNAAYNLTAAGNKVFYFTYGLGGETVLSKTDGTAGGTGTVKDFIDISSGGPLGHEVAGGLFYFALYSNTTGRELYRSDGTEGGTFLVKDISSSTDYFAGPVQLTAFNGQLYFSDDDGSGQKLWLTDGTTSGTRLANNGNVTVSTDYSFAFINAHFAVQGNHLYTAASTPATGEELYKYNPASGFSLVKDITPGAAGGFPSGITPAFGKIAFVYYDTIAQQNELWAVNETNGARLLASGSFYENLTPGNGLLYFISGTKEAGTELWKTNGTTEGTALVKDIYTGTTSSSPQDLTYVNGTLYFNAASKNTGTELWQSQGNAAGTKLITEIDKTATAYSGPYFYNGTIIDFPYLGATGAFAGKTYYFTATQPEMGYELYKSDGTGAGTVLAKDFIPGEGGSNPQAFTSKKGVVYCKGYAADSGIGSVDIYKADSLGNISRVAASFDSYIYSYDVADNGWVYYVDFDIAAGSFRLRRTNGTDTNSIILANNLSGQNGGSVVKTVGNTAYFTATGANGTELWKSNGSVAGTMQVKDINMGAGSSNPYSLTAFKNNIYFGADDGSGIALWRSNGTAGGTVKLKTIQPYGIYSYQYEYPDYFCVVNDVLYLDAFTPATGYELWKTNGTAAGTVLVKDITGDASDSKPAYLTNVNGTLFFNASFDELWKSDGTVNGTVEIAEVPASSYFLFSSRCVAGGKFFFNASRLLYVSDGTGAGTHTVYDNGLNGVSLVNNLAASGNQVFFNGYTDKYSYELYTGDAGAVTPSVVSTSQPIAKKPASFSASVVQNPVGSTVRLNIASEADQTIHITVTNVSGNIKAQQEAVAYKGNNTTLVNAGNWQPGVYLVNLRNAAGDVVSVRVFK